jgi:hypothetical protein
MRTNKLVMTMRAAAGATLLAALLAGCAKREPAPEAVQPPSPSPATPAVPDVAPPADTMPAPDAVPGGPAQPAPDAPSPTEPSAAPKPTAAHEPSIESMRAATPGAKMSVAADLRYSFDTEVAAGQPAMLHLAAVPRAPGVNLRISVQQAKGLQIAPGPMRLQKSSTTDVYRQQVSVTKLAAAPAEMWVLVTMETAEGSGFGYFSIPLAGTIAQKEDSAKQR